MTCSFLKCILKLVCIILRSSDFSLIRLAIEIHCLQLVAGLRLAATLINLKNNGMASLANVTLWDMANVWFQKEMADGEGVSVE